MMIIKINFVDFWPGFKKENNYFYNLLAQQYEVIIDEKNPDLLFYSCYSSEYLRYKCTRIFYTPENIRPDFTACDFAFSFDYTKKKKHFRLPYYSVVIDKGNMIEDLQRSKLRGEGEKIWQSKSKFCCILVSNPNSKRRLEFFTKLSAIKKVDSGGRVLNNIGNNVYDKLEFIKDYKFVIAFENSSYNGYTTEKILDPIYRHCIPIYWGDPLIKQDFNTNRFINYSDFNSEEELIDKILEIDQNDELAIDMILQPTFSHEKLPHHEEHEKVKEILSKIINSKKRPIATQSWRYIHFIKFYYKKIRKRIVAKFDKFQNIYVCSL